MFDWLEVSLGGCIIFLFVMLGFAIKGDMDHKKVFMQECLKDHKQYECDSLWAGMNPPSSAPIIIPIYSTR